MRKEPTSTNKGGKRANSSQRMLPGQGKLPAKAARQAEDSPCPSRGPHDEKCLCKGTGSIKVIK